MPSRSLRGTSPDDLESFALSAVAPARVNIIGEHTDHNDGLVLPTCTALFTRVGATPRSDRTVRVTTSTLGETVSFSLDELAPGQSASWVEYIKGVAAGLLDAGSALQGTELVIDSDIPLGAGLSSSASLELAVARALLAIAGKTLPAEQLARICQQAEHDYAGVQCGIMDQYALACARLGSALLLDCQSMQTRQIALPADLAFILTDSGVRHQLSDGNYNDRADECAAAVKILARSNPAVKSLRDVDVEMLANNESELGEVLFKRCRHVVSENQRVLDIVTALEAAELSQIGSLLTACHASLRDDFAVSCAPIDALVASANDSELVLGSRMVGGGFGGCVLSACRSHNAAKAAAHIRDVYAAANGEQPWQHQVVPAHPARVTGEQ